ncbi:Hypothetical protein, putative, partial [Bodo saltans]
DLVRLCQSLHLPAPERYELASYGRAPHKMFVVHQAIQGTPYLAIGTGSDTFTAIGRASMHYTWVAHRVSAANSATTTSKKSLSTGGSSPTSMLGMEWGKNTPLVQRPDIAADRQHHHSSSSALTNAARGGTSGDVTDETLQHVMSILKLYTATHPPSSPVSYQFRERPHPSGSTVHVCTAEMMDETGLRVTAKAESTMDSSAAKKNALVDLHKLLLSKAGMLSLTRFWHTPASSSSSTGAVPAPGFNRGSSSCRSVCLTTTIALPSLAVRERLAAHLLLRKGVADDGRTDATDAPLKSLPSRTAPAVTELKITPMLTWFLSLRGADDERSGGGGATSSSSSIANDARNTINWAVFVQRLGLTTAAAAFVTPLGRRVQSMIRIITSMPVARWLQERSNSTEAAEVAEELHQLVDGISRGEWFSELLIRCSVFLAVSQTIGVRTRVCADAVAVVVKLLMSPLPAPTQPPLESIDNRQEQTAYTASTTTTELLTWLDSRQKLQEDDATGKMTSVTSSAERMIAHHIEASLGISSPPPPPASVSSRPHHPHPQRDTNRARLQLAYVCAFGESASAFVMAHLEDDGRYTAVSLGDNDGQKRIVQLPPPVSMCSNSKGTTISSAGAAAVVPSSGSSQPSSLPRRVLLCTAAPQVLGTSIGMSIDSPWLLWFGASVSSSPAIRPRRGVVPADDSGRQSSDPLLLPRLLEIDSAGDVINLRTLWNGRACFCVSMEPLTTSSSSSTTSMVPPKIAGGASSAVSSLGKKPNVIVQPMHSSHTTVGRSSLTTARPPTLAGGALFLEQLEELAHHLRRDLGNADGCGDGARPPQPSTASSAVSTSLDFVLELLLTCQQLVMVDGVRQRTSATGRPQHCIGVLETL